MSGLDYALSRDDKKHLQNCTPSTLSSDYNLIVVGMKMLEGPVLVLLTEATYIPLLIFAFCVYVLLYVPNF